MIKINKPSMVFTTKALLRYTGTNYNYLQEKRFEKMVIIEREYNLREDLIVQHTMFDGTQIMFSMISGKLYIKENGYYELKEGQNFCDFILFWDEKFMVFEGNISYMNNVNDNFKYKEDFKATMILPYDKHLLKIWEENNKLIG
ncbi:hypothetical protein EZL74_11195 [Flavobacterium silvisoli]|uniref:Uncharacterized protein n=1 Tax=Flavobacterium silvisoli TaxID=2529433 RepID=A0A4Q9YRY5_9FLAO|nr:hypothetical protein [Flavobacterium silvisoli]TBX66145.1 hypothetical protein EZL74_11195 [Flavobacterium silvisoli]